MRSGMIPSLIHHTDSGERLPSPTLANGAPLSVRMALGRPYSRNARSRTRLASGPLGRSRSHTSRYLGGSIPTLRCGTTPWIDHTSFGLLAPEKGSAHAADASPVRHGPSAACRPPQRMMRRSAAVQQTRLTLSIVAADHLVGTLAADAALTLNHNYPLSRWNGNGSNLCLDTIPLERGG